MRLPKRYGESKIDKCPFCGRLATTTNSMNVPVCREHKNETLDEMKCACGKVLELKNGKFGPFYNCIDCGNLSMVKVLEFNNVKAIRGVEGKRQIKHSTSTKPSTAGSDDKANKSLPAPDRKTLFATAPEKKNSREIVVRADDPFYCS
ncbi:hypothetical protein JW711_02900 [Candidatus Woesearchaeota archaeon]|nr:hypothetical protein [Candidatus Woesearchaeota archaeon]